MMLLTSVLVPALALSVIGAPMINRGVKKAHAEQTAVASMETRAAAVPDTSTVLPVGKRANETGSIWYVEKRADETGSIWSVEKREDENGGIWSVEKRATSATKLEQPKRELPYASAPEAR